MTGSWLETADGVFVRRYRELHLTTGLVLGSNGAVVVDARGDESQGAEWASAVREVTDLPLTVVLTHAHFDHCFGARAFGSVPVVAHPRCRAALAATAQAQREEWVRRYLDAGDIETAQALRDARPVLPDAAPAELDLGGGRVVELRYLGRGHTDHDLVVHVPDADVVYAGDLVEESGPPDVEDADLHAWPNTLDALLALNPRVIVPGHGEPVDPAFVARQRGDLAERAELRRH